MTESQFREIRAGLYPTFAELETALTALLFVVQRASSVQDIRASPAFSRAHVALHTAREWALKAGEGELSRRLAAAIGPPGPAGVPSSGVGASAENG